jgi:ketosteroid isomerase-like protein
MSAQNETKAITTLINDYAEVLNSGDVKAVGNFYANNGAILPDGFNTVTKKKLDDASGEFLSKNKFKIEYKIENVTVTGKYAFVESLATTSINASGGSLVNKISRDIFILQKDQNAWKIYRYIFNGTK